jgi:hypothetical protein
MVSAMYRCSRIVRRRRATRVGLLRKREIETVSPVMVGADAG